jgi:acyl carrier protein
LATQVRTDELQHLPKVIYGRALKVLAVAKAHGHDSLVLGAWGCGAFGNNGSLVADIFHKALTQDFAGSFKEVTFAIVDTSPEGRFIRPFARRFSPEAIGSIKAEKPLSMADVIERTDVILRKHLDMPEGHYARLRFWDDLNKYFIDCIEVICELEFEFRIPNLEEANASRIQTVGQLYDYVLRNGRDH